MDAAKGDREEPRFLPDILTIVLTPTLVLTKGPADVPLVLQAV